MLTSTQIDWITAHLKIPGLEHHIDDGVMQLVTHYGEVERQTRRYLSVPGSYVDQFRVRTIDHPDRGMLLTLSGCPPKFLQGHNLSGTTKLFPLVKFLYDEIRRLNPDLELPERGDEIEFDLRRLDITRQFYAVTETEDGKRRFIRPQDVIDHYERSAKTRFGKGIMRAKTLYFNRPNTRYWKAKMYAKGAELDAHPVKDLSVKDSHGSKLREFAEPIIRIEIQLNDKTLEEIHADDFVDCARLFDRFWGRVEVTGMNSMEKTHDQIMKLPPAYRCTFYDWQNGVDLKARMNEQTFYRHRRRIIKDLDLDIAIPRKQKGKHALAITDWRKFRLLPIEPPDWLQEISFDPDAQKHGRYLRG